MNADVTGLITDAVSGLQDTVLGVAGAVLPIGVLTIAIGLGFRMVRKFVKA